MQDSTSGRAGSLINHVLAKVDPVGWASATASVAAHAATSPFEVAHATAKFWSTSARIPRAAVAGLLGQTAEAPIEPDPKDRRFADPAWEQNPVFFAIRQLYLAACELGDDVLLAGKFGDVRDVKAEMLMHLLADALSPTNFAATNPEVLMRAFQSGGHSLLTGARYAADDVVHRGGRPLKVDTSAFELGTDLAATPGKVVFRNDLVELIQYAPQTETVHEVPILAVPPWINKYYIMDLAPGRSFAEWAVQHGRTVFMLSYRDPDETLSHLTMDDYLEMAPLAGLDVVGQITGADTIDVVGLCLGGALAGMTAGYLAGNDDRLGSLTLLNTMLDYTDPGKLCSMVDSASLERLEARMAETGFLAAKDMSLSFDLLRANDLIFNYVVSRWLKGEPPPAFDILAWNEDSTRMPAAMHSTYLRSLYDENLLARGEMALAGRALDLTAVTADTYIVGAINDHIVPWTSSYASQRLLGGDVRFVLSSGGHVAGIVNPPGPKGWWEALEPSGRAKSPTYPEDPQQWRANATTHSGSWWEDWTAWSAARAGAQRKPPRMGGRRYKVLADAPGRYVTGRGAPRGK